MKAQHVSTSQRASSRIAVCGWTLRPESPHQLLQRLDALHISAVQMSLTQIVEDPNEWGDAIDILRDGGVWIVSGMMAMAGDDYRRLDLPSQSSLLADHTWFKNRFHAEKIARLADREGIGLITTQIGVLPADPSGPEWAKIVDRAGAIAEIFAHYGITLAIETGQSPAERLDRLIDDLNTVNLGVNFDPAAIVMGGLGDPIASLRRLAQRVRQVHVRDATAAGGAGRSAREVPVGHGMVDWDALFEIALGILPPVHFVIERDPRVARDEDIVAARELIATHLQPPDRFRRT